MRNRPPSDSRRDTALAQAVMANRTDEARRIAAAILRRDQEIAAKREAERATRGHPHVWRASK